MRKKFSRWVRWEERNDLNGINYPGIYCLAVNDCDISGNPHQWIERVCYIGMTISKGGLRGRLGQLHRTILSPDGVGHGGAQRIKHAYPQYETLRSQLFVSIDWFDFDPSNETVSAWRAKGEVAKHEFVCIASYLKIHGKIPVFNRMDSPKFRVRDSQV